MSLFTPEEVLSSLIDLPIQDQISVLEGLLADHSVAEVVDVLSLCLMSVMLGVDAFCSDDLRNRLDALIGKVRQFNEERFGRGPSA
ncbi:MULTISPECIES: hypothetical protein [Ralstonia]|jgi:hypothetical protein|uniref:Uncharacterized protein n=2 Tax=Ralstonia pickettii TaxID=329 RepID=R0CNC8_RALPI|nr:MULTISPECIES: hypothetical protein [Ralstonia]ENZ77990.1 hypothetical protein OR214_02266 [Ralstonia pickettii OR214]MCM3581919.1 hypothetical protein [Ralstonia pickettii]